MSPFQRLISTKLFFRASIVFTILLSVLLAVNKFVVPIYFWMVLTSFLSLPFLCVSLWIQAVRKENDFVSSYFILFVLSFFYFILYGWALSGEYLSVLGQLAVFFLQLIISGSILQKSEKLGRRLGGPPLKVV